MTEENNTSKNIDIDCHYHNKEKRQWYVDEKMKLLPCCFYSSAEIFDNLEIEDPVFAKFCKDNPGWNDLSLHSMEEIVSSKMYQEHIYFPGWESNPSKCCIQNCGVKTKRRVSTGVKMKRGGD